MIDNGCVSCQKEDANETTPENSSSSQELDYARTDTTFQSSKRQLKSQYERANDLLAA